jgi:hypothetical protein
MGQGERPRARPGKPSGMRKVAKVEVGRQNAWRTAFADCLVDRSQLEILKFYIRITQAS